MSFLKEWDTAIMAARIQGKPGHVWSFERNNLDPFPIGRLVARTMHPAFMAGVLPVVKHDPERDQ
jgi:hypothetical protein